MDAFASNALIYSLVAARGEQYPPLSFHSMLKPWGIVIIVAFDIFVSLIIWTEPLRGENRTRFKCGVCFCSDPRSLSQGPDVPWIPCYGWYWRKSTCSGIDILRICDIVGRLAPVRSRNQHLNNIHPTGVKHTPRKATNMSDENTHVVPDDGPEPEQRRNITPKT